MNVFVSGINYKTAPLEVREKLSFNAEGLKAAVGEIFNLPGVNECVILSTCNRTEVYIYSEKKHFNFDTVERLLCSLKDTDIYDYRKYFISYEGQKAVRHLFKVSCGLDSLILGEDQILSQVKSAHELAHGMRTTSTVLNTLFREAVTAAKRIKTGTGISKSPVSAGSVAVRLLDDVFDCRLEDKTALIIGMGKIGSITLKNLIGRGIGRFYITNRTHREPDCVLKNNSGIVYVDYNDRYSVINEADIVISSTSSPHYTITRDMIERTVTDFRKRVFIDLAVPRDIDDSIKEIPGTWYYNIDDLKSAVDKSFDRRFNETSKAEEIIDEYIKCYEKWYMFREVLPVIREVQKYTDDFLEAKVTQTISKLKSASEEDKEIVRTSMRNMANNILETFLYRVRDNSSKDDLATYFRCLSETISDKLNS